MTARSHDQTVPDRIDPHLEVPFFLVLVDADPELPLDFGHLRQAALDRLQLFRFRLRFRLRHVPSVALGSAEYGGSQHATYD